MISHRPRTFVYVEGEEASRASEPHRYRTKRVEHLMLFATAALLPLENQIPTIMGIGFMFFVFGSFFVYLLVNRAGMLDKVWAHPVFLTTYGFVLVILVLESSQPHSDYSEISRIAQMVAGAVLVAALCRDQSALRAGIYGWLAAGSWVTLFLMSTSYSSMSGSSATDFASASAVRDQAFEHIGFTANLNTLAFFAVQGAVGALALGLKERSSRRRTLFLAVMLVCVVGAFLPMSRGAIMSLAIAGGAVMVAYGILRARMVVVLALLAIGIWILVPEAVFSRLVFKAQSYEPGKLEARTQVYTSVLENLPEFIITGVGAGHFWKSWGRSHGFAYGSGVLGSHNCFAQVTIYWGILGLLGVVAVIYQAYRCFPTSCGTEALKLALLGTSISLLPLMMTMHQLYAKQLSLGLGLLVGAACWIWPRALSTGKLQRQANTGLPFR